MTRTALYRLFTADDQLLYVGVAKDPEARWENHATFAAWWPAVARKTVEWHGDRPTAETAERRAIRTEVPLHNTQHNPRMTEVTQVSWWEYVMTVTGDASHSEIARKCGLSQPSVTMWRKCAPKPETINAFAKAYGVLVIDAFIAAGYLTKDEALQIFD